MVGPPSAVVIAQSIGWSPMAAPTCMVAPLFGREVLPDGLPWQPSQRAALVSTLLMASRCVPVSLLALALVPGLWIAWQVWQPMVLVPSAGATVGLLNLPPSDQAFRGTTRFSAALMLATGTK